VVTGTNIQTTWMGLMTRKFYILLLVLLPLMATPASQATPDSLLLQMAVKIDTSQVAPIVFDHDTLFEIHAGMKGLSAIQRAEVIQRRIIEGLAETDIPLDSLFVEDSGVSSDILAQDRFILALYDVDASFAGSTRTALARQLVASLQKSVGHYREERSQSTLLQGILLSLVATVVLVVVLRLLSLIGRWLDTMLGARIQGISVRQTEIIRAEWLRKSFHSFQQFARGVLVIVVVYSYLQFVLSRFVWTRELAGQLLDLTLGPLRTIGLSLWNYLPNLFFLLVLWFLTRYVIKFFRFIFGEIDRGRIVLPGFYADWATPTFKIVRVLIVAFALVVAFPYIPGSDSPAFKGVSIFLGVLFSLGSTSAVANIVAGVILTYMRSFRVGEVVRIQDTVGLVVNHSLLVTRLRTPKNVEVTIPNSTILGTHVVNYSVEARKGRLILPTSITIGYDTPWRQVHALLHMAAEKTTDILKEPQPFVLQSALNDFYVTYELNVYSDAPEHMPRIYSELHQNIQDAFNEYGVQIMSPNYVMDRAKPTVVPPEQWYEPPAKKPGAPGTGMPEIARAPVQENPPLNSETVTVKAQTEG
jgi:small-conductance mechanosensitive channel